MLNLQTKFKEMSNTITINGLTIGLDKDDVLEALSSEQLQDELESRGYYVSKDAPEEPCLSDFDDNEISNYILNNDLNFVSTNRFNDVNEKLEILTEKYEPRNIIEADCITEFYRILRKGEISIYDVKQIGIKLLID